MTLWDAVLEAGKPHGLEVIGPCHIRRIEGGILALGPGCDMWYDTNPYEVGMGYDWMVDLESGTDFIGKEALAKIKAEGPKRKLVGVEIGGEQLGSYNDGSMIDVFPVHKDGSQHREDHVGLLLAAAREEHRLRDGADRAVRARHGARGRAAGGDDLRGRGREAVHRPEEGDAEAGAGRELVSEHYDFVIVGGGSAGQRARQPALGRPEHERRSCSRRAGSDYPWDVFIHMPAALAFPIGSRFYDWKYESEPEPHMGGRRVYHARGKVLGGSSSINGMIFQRGNPMDYERWASDAGMETWDHAHCLPYFKRMENCLAAAPDDPFRGHDGPLVLERGPAKGPLFDAFFEAVQQAGYPLTDDVNGYRQEGFAAFDRNVHDGKRLSAARAYLHPVMSRPNLTVETRAFTTKILFEGKRAVGVEYARRGRGGRTVRANEVIVCGGAINSPQLLQLSGVGAASELGALGIEVVADLPGVGENLQDHLEVYVQHSSTQPVTMAPYFAMKRRPLVGARVAAAQDRPGRHEPLRGGRVRARQRRGEVPEPHVPLPPDRGPLRRHAPRGRRRPRLPGARGPDVLRRARHLQDREPRPARQAGAALQLPLDRERPARVDRGGPRDAEDPGRAGLRAVQRRRAVAGREVDTDEQILDWVAKDAETALHPSCTARMGTDDMSAVDPLTMRVHGTEGLRVVDASVFPYVTNGNIYAPVMMVAEKAADLILGNTPLPAEPVEFYRHGESPSPLAGEPAASA